MTSIGDQPAFPVDLGQTHPRPGMTYRQWLIGMCAQGILAYPRSCGPDSVARASLAHADAILDALDAEKENP